MSTFRIEQNSSQNGKHLVRLVLLSPGKADRRAEATIEFALSPQEQEELRWYLEDYLKFAHVTVQTMVDQIITMMRRRGIELYQKVFTANANTQALWFAVRDQLADLRIEISTTITEAVSIPWELMHDPELDSPIALRSKAFVRIQSHPNIDFVPVPAVDAGRLRLLYIVCRPGGSEDVSLRAIANRLLQDLGPDLARFDITALRPPTFEQLQAELACSKAAGRPYHIVHFDGHGMYADLGKNPLPDWHGALSGLVLGGAKNGKHGYLLFELPGGEGKIRPVDGQTLGKLLHDYGVPVLVLNACQSAMHEAAEAPSSSAESVHDEIRAIGSLSQAVIDQGIPAVLGMRYSVYVVTAAQYVGEVYRALARGQSFGEAASHGRKHLYLNPERWLGLQPRVLQDWFVPVVYEAMPIALLPIGDSQELGDMQDRDPAMLSAVLRRYVPDGGFVGRDETMLVLDRAFDEHRIVLLHAFAGQGKTSAAVEFARWYSLTQGLGHFPVVLFNSFEHHNDLARLLNQIAQTFASMLEARGIHWHAIHDPEARRRHVVQLLRHVPVLWIWDNIEPVTGFPAGTESQWTAAEQEDLRDFLKQIKLDTASKVKVLLTSRRDEQDWLGALPKRIEMPRMSNPDAASLARRLGGEKEITRDAIGDWLPLLDYCAGNPLTLHVLVGQAVRMGLSGKEKLADFISSIRSGEQHVQDVDASEGRDCSLGASLDYGFKTAFSEDDLSIIALLHLFQGTVILDVLELMGRESGQILPRLKDKSKEQLRDLLRRAAEIGLLSQFRESVFIIHPALPWFLKPLFARCYEGQNGCGGVRAVEDAWVQAMGFFGGASHIIFTSGNLAIVDLLGLNEANLLHARQLACRRHNWPFAIGAMQGLRTLLRYHSRWADWKKLVEEVTPFCCSEDDAPILGREDEYVQVMDFRVKLAQEVEHDVVLARALLVNLVEVSHRLASGLLDVPVEIPLDVKQRSRIRNVAASLVIYGQILRDSGDAECLSHLKRAIRYSERIGDSAAQAMTEFNLGHAYKDVRGIRDLDAAQDAYQRSLALTPSKNVILRCNNIKQIGMVHHARLHEAQAAKAPEDIQQGHFDAALKAYSSALSICPESAQSELGSVHAEMGILFSNVGDWEDARMHFEVAIACFERSGDHLGVGRGRYNMALMYVLASHHEPELNSKHKYLLRAEAYAQAAMRDYSHYEGRAASYEENARKLVGEIARRLAEVPGA